MIGYRDSFPSDSMSARLERADLRGTSAKWPSLDAPYLGWSDDENDGPIYEQKGILPLKHIMTACLRFNEDQNADISDLLRPFEDEEN